MATAKSSLMTSVMTTALLALIWSYNWHLYKFKLDLESNLAIITTLELNNTWRGDEDALVFVRVPKTGSQKVWSLLDRLAPINGFSSYSDSFDLKRKRGGENTIIPEAVGRASYARVWRDNCSRPFSYSKHIHFMDVYSDTEGSMANPMYVSMVRDPVERVISWYYYRRSLAHVMDSSNNESIALSSSRPTLHELKTSFESCVIEKECNFQPGQNLYTHQAMPHLSQVAFFCGHEPICMRFETDEALLRAKTNVEKHFSVVGVLEQLEDSLYVMEHFLPKFFKNAVSLHLREINKDDKEDNTGVVNGNVMKPKVNEDFKSKLRSNFSREIDFYEFCKNRLAKQRVSIN